MEQFRSKHKQTQSEWEAEMSKKVLEFVRSELYMDLRFLDIALGTLVYRADENIRSFATDGTYLYFSTEQVLRVFQGNPKYLDRAYLHSVLHCLIPSGFLFHARLPCNFIPLFSGVLICGIFLFLLRPVTMVVRVKFLLQCDQFCRLSAT